MSLILALALSLQVTQTPPIVKGTGLPLADSDEGAVMRPVSALLAAIAARDPVAAEAQLFPGGIATITVDQPADEHTVMRITFEQFLASFKDGTSRVEERLTGQPAIEIEGDIAMVWAPYEFRENGVVKHCGFDHFSLVRHRGQWKIATITWSQRSDGCGAQ